MTEWIEWNGYNDDRTEPPIPIGTVIDVRYRIGTENKGVHAGYEFDEGGSDKDHNANDWSIDGHEYDIVAYRIAETVK